MRFTGESNVGYQNEMQSKSIKLLGKISHVNWQFVNDLEDEISR
jgi:hypothetical protein